MNMKSKIITIIVGIIIITGVVFFFFPPKAGLGSLAEQKLVEILSTDNRPSHELADGSPLISWYEKRYVLFDTVWGFKNPVGEQEYQLEDFIDETLILVPFDTHVISPSDGHIVDLGYNAIDGNYIKIRTDSGLYINIAHLSGYMEMWMNGESVSRGQKLAYSGQSGNCTDSERLDSVPWPAVGISVEYRDRVYQITEYIDVWE